MSGVLGLFIALNYIELSFKRGTFFLWICNELNNWLSTWLFCWMFFELVVDITVELMNDDLPIILFVVVVMDVVGSSFSMLYKINFFL